MSPCGGREGVSARFDQICARAIDVRSDRRNAGKMMSAMPMKARLSGWPREKMFWYNLGVSSSWPPAGAVDDMVGSYLPRIE
jgi:hypothetical protein